MAGLETLAKYGYLSDEQRWNAHRYVYDWLPELDEHDRKIIKVLDCLRDGEFSGQASVALFYDLMREEREAGYSGELLGDWFAFMSYVNIIVYEEFRHGAVLGILYHYVTTGRTDYLATVDVRDLSRRTVWCFDEHRYWDMYSYGLAHLFAEVINTELYRDVAERAHHPRLQETLHNIMKDEARHAVAWKDIFRDLIASDPEHKRRALASLDRALVYHNAMVHDRYFEGLNKMLPLFISRDDEHKSALDRIAHRKHKILEEVLGVDNPYSASDVVNMHMKFLAQSYGRNRAQFSESAPGNIVFS